MTTARRRSAAAPLLLLTAATCVWAGGPADHTATAPRGHSVLATAPERPGPSLRPGATLAPPKILGFGSAPAGIGRMVEDQDGTERREDVGTQVTVELQAEVLFGKDSARLSRSARSRIASLAREIEPQPGATIRVYGFTDNLGSASHGDRLSRQRAAAVQNVLAEDLKGAAVRFDTRGFGERRPVASNATEAGRLKNRRVQISFPSPSDSRNPSGRQRRTHADDARTR